jgi:PTS system fructose-specific IIC component/PTS system nitrogen regulatory IIA component
MLLQDVLLPQFIKLDMEAQDKDEAFTELVDFYCKTGKCASRDEILEAITAREAKMSTGIRKGIAVPHGKTGAVKTIQAVLGISWKGIQYDALDGEPVHLLFMIISPPDEPENHLRLLKHLAELFDKEQFQVQLQLVNDPQSAFKVIKKFEEQ